MEFVLHSRKQNRPDRYGVSWNLWNRRNTLGSNTEKIVRLSEVPVMVIKKETTDFKGDHFVLLPFFRRNKKTFQKMLNFVQIF
jgi:hypothetical protein